MAKWGPGPKNLEKGTSETTPKVLLFHTIVSLFSSYFSVISWSVPRKHFSDFGGQSVPKEGPLGSLFWTFCRKAGKVKPMVWWRPNTTFHGFYALGSERFGLFFQPVFQTGSGGVILRFCVKLGVQPEPKIVTFGKRLVLFGQSFPVLKRLRKQGRNTFQTAKARLQSFLIDIYT